MAACKAASLTCRVTLTHCIKRWFRLFLLIFPHSGPRLSFTRPVIPDMKFVADPKNETSQASLHKPHVSHYRNISTLYFAKPPLLIKSSQAFRKAELPFRARYSDRTSERRTLTTGLFTELLLSAMRDAAHGKCSSNGTWRHAALSCWAVAQPSDWMFPNGKTTLTMFS